MQEIMATYTGTVDNDTILGGAGADSISGLAGDDALNGLAGNDTLDGGEGFDEARYDQSGITTGVSIALAAGTVTGADTGKDLLRSIEAVRGTAFGDLYDATGFGGPDAANVGSQTVYNRFEGRGGNDTIIGNGYTEISYAAATAGVSVSLTTGRASGNASVGSDLFSGVYAVTGSDFADSLVGGGAGRPGDAMEVLTGGRGADTIVGAGYDWAGYSPATAGIAVDLKAGTAQDGQGSTDKLTSIHGIIGSGFADTILGSDSADYFMPGAGNDSIDGRGGFDVVWYIDARAAVTVNLKTGVATDGEGGTDKLVRIEGVRGSAFADVLTGDAKGNWFEGGDGADTIDGGDGIDTVSYAYAPAGVQVNLTNESANDDGTGSADRLIGIENVEGSNFADVIYGDGGANVLRGYGGNDIIDAFDGDDLLDGGDGNDYLRGGEGADTLDGGAGNDTLDDSDDSGAPNVLVGGAGNDILYAGKGFDFLIGGLGNDSIAAGAGNDTIDESADPDGANTLKGEDGDDVIYGGGGNDTIRGGRGIDVVYGGGGDDFIDESDDDGNNANVLVGGAGNDTIFGAVGKGTSAVDLIIGGDGNDQIDGNAGNDTIYGDNADFTGRGADVLNGNDGDDVIFAGGGADTITGGRGFDVLYGESGDDRIDESGDDGANSNVLVGGDGNDLLLGGTGQDAASGIGDYIIAGAGADTVYGNGGDDIIYGDNADLSGSGADRIDGGDGNDVIYAGGGNDTIFGGAGIDVIYGGDGNDVIDERDDTSGNVLVGDAGNDSIYGGRGNDFISGGAGSDYIVGGGGDDIVSTGTGRDTIFFDQLRAGTMTILDFNPATDTFAFQRSEFAGLDGTGVTAGTSFLSGTVEQLAAANKAAVDVVVIRDGGFNDSSSALAAISGTGAALPDTGLLVIYRAGQDDFRLSYDANGVLDGGEHFLAAIGGATGMTDANIATIVASDFVYYV